MRKELDEKLCKDFPLIFQNRHGSPQVTSMCWGFSCDDGWFDLIYRLCDQIQKHIDFSHKRKEFDLKWNQNVNDPNYEWNSFLPREERDITEPVTQVIATQVKEKYGGLRFYYSGGDDYIRGLVNMAEAMSYKICEVTGNKGVLHIKNGYYQTLSIEEGIHRGFDVVGNNEGE